MSADNHDDADSDIVSPCDEKTSKKRSANGGNSSSSSRVDDSMKYDDLRNLETIFNENSGEVGLDMQQFRVAMKRIMGNHIDDDKLDMMFMKVDTNCDGTVDWDEYLSYMLLEFQEKENMVNTNSGLPFPKPMKEKQCNHMESICGISLLQAYSIRNNGKIELDDQASRYMTLSKEGVLNIWNVQWSLQKSTLLDGMRNNPRAVWFTSIVCMPNCNTIAVASTDYEISFYSMSTNMCQKKFQIKDLDCCALALDYHFEYTDTKKSILVWGDTSGSVYVLRFYDNPSLALFSSTSPSCTDNKISVISLVKGHIHNLRVARFQHLHPDWIRELRYYVNEKQQEFFVSCCREQQNSMLFADITEKLTGNANKKIEMHRKYYFNLHNGVTCASYDPDWNLIVTGSSDFNVRVWNPYIVNTSTMVLKGHCMAVQQVYVRMVDHHAITVSRDKNIRIWDLLDYTCKQSIHGRHVQLGRLDVSAMFFNERRMELVLGTNTIGVFTPSASSFMQTAKKMADATCHSKPITKVLYNSLFKQLITGSEDSMVSIWDLKTGFKTMQFCTDVGVEITSMAFDPTKRRLITGLRNGGISIWNFNNGARLRELKRSGDLEVSSVLHAKNRIISSGWNKNVTVYLDSYTDESFRRMRMQHKDDILSMDYHKLENVLGTSSYDGDIFIWSLDVECVLSKFNMYVSILPIQEMKNQTKSDDWLAFPRTASATKRFEQNFISLPDYLPWIKDSKKVNKIFENNYDDDSGFPEDKKMHSSDKAVNKIIFLQSRRSTNNIAVLFSATVGYVVAWSVHQRGGILGYFNATKHSGEMIVDMETDVQNKILITADSRGYIRVWSVGNYCNETDVTLRRNSLKTNKVLNLFEGVDKKQADAYREQHAYVPMDTKPQMLTSFRGHCRAITSISFINEMNLIASGSADCSVRLWTIKGRYIGAFGQQNQWNLELPIKDSDLPIAIPTDVRRIASPTSLHTIKGGYHHQWKQVKHAVGFVGATSGLLSRLMKKVKVADSGEDEIKRRFSTLSEKLVNSAKPEKRNSVDQRRGSVTFWMEDRPHSIASNFKKVDEVEDMYQRIEKNGITSKFLGKINYKPKRRHRQSGIDTTIRWIDQNAIVYSTLPCSELNDSLQLTKPESCHKQPAPTPQHTLSKCTNKVTDRRRVNTSFIKRQSFSFNSNMSQRPQKHSTFDVEAYGDSAEESTSTTRLSSGSSHKTKKVSFNNLV